MAHLDSAAQYENGYELPAGYGTSRGPMEAAYHSRAAEMVPSFSQPVRSHSDTTGGVATHRHASRAVSPYHMPQGKHSTIPRPTGHAHPQNCVSWYVGAPGKDVDLYGQVIYGICGCERPGPLAVLCHGASQMGDAKA
jgi:hypothetical protein